ncbi:hypothetical protein XENOCAPTIV_023847, partial [Xenoophorus captivus]
ALEILQEVNRSVNRRTSFSKLAMISLLNSNLSACLGQTVLTLEELSKQPVNQRRAIIAVNTATEYES